MTKNLRAFLAVVASVSVAGVMYMVTVIKPGADAGDVAALAGECPAVRLECQVRVKDSCRELPDGGMRRKYATVQTKAGRCPAEDGGTPTLVMRPQFPACFETYGSGCTLVESGCTDSEVCDEASGVTARTAQDKCACRNPATGPCRTPSPDGGATLQTPLGVTIQPPFGGAGCFRKTCETIAANADESWPDECPSP